MTAVFDSYAAYYDLLYGDKNYSAEANFVDDLLAKHGVPDRGTLLELGCGTGKHAAELARKGYGIHGLDVSVSMVQAANDQKPSEFAQLLQFELGDVRTARIGRQFDAVISLFHVASYQVTNADLTAMFQTGSNAFEGRRCVFIRLLVWPRSAYRSACHKSEAHEWCYSECAQNCRACHAPQ